MAIGRGSGREERREPRFDANGQSSPDLRVTPQDRPTGGGDFRASSDREPRFEPRDEGRREPNFGGRSEGPDVGAKPQRRKSSYWAWVMGRSQPARERGGGDGGGRKRRGLLAKLVSLVVALGLFGAIGAGGVVAYYASRLPAYQNLEVPKRPPNVQLIGYDGKPLANRGETGGANVPLGEMPKYVPQAFIAIEDRRFYDHWGVDIFGLARAVKANIQRGGVAQGGSTLTQQLAKNLFLTPERSMERKVQEAVLAFYLERKFGKQKILEMYLNRVYFGAGAYGVEAASQRYFGKSIRKVNVTEAAMLAGLVKAPSRLSPSRDPDAARARADVVLAAMADEGYITRDQAQSAFKTQPPSPAPKPEGAIGYAADWVMDQIDSLVGVYDEDLIVETTIDPALETEAERDLADVIAKKGGKLKVSQGVLVSLGPDGAVRALVGGKSYAESQFNRAVDAKRQPGSSFKPFVYLTALQMGLTPDTVRVDEPLQLKGWSPENYTRRYAGPMTLTYALSQSINTVAVKLGVEVGPDHVVQTAHDLGITSKLDPNPSIALGTSEVSPLEMAAAYAPFANGGTVATPYIVRSVKSSTGEPLYVRKTDAPKQVLDEERVGMINAMLSETLKSGTARGATFKAWPAAGKTGTSQDFRDAWFIGYTAQFVTAVWLGNDDNSPTKHASGGGLPVEIWSRFMAKAHEGMPVAELPGEWSPRVAGYERSGPDDVYQTGPGQGGGEPPEEGPYQGSYPDADDGYVARQRERRTPDIVREPLGFLKHLFGG
ncbi:transglycosylase domain-containing protein [Hansschlegelia quercus]|uniref:Penicillin-binding protein 1A n=1 Tax=Hansschlegelia quercus TaxID=2528245 RepID=A0A4Q9GFQ1_9HYPH|nr:penicillin-binding protein 1A [Hansschlegelia quercus]TBN47628.1 penicillin-binding protein 1A [Hansschlegelia quercus]